MKYKVKQIIETEIEVDDVKNLTIECHNGIDKKFQKCVFAPIEYDAEELITLTREDGVILKWNKTNRKFEILENDRQ